MSQVTVTLPDGSVARCPPGALVRDVAEAISPRLAKAALAGVVDGRLVDLSYPLEQDAAGPDRDRQEPRGAAALSPQHGAPAGRRRDATCSRRAVRHRSGHRRRLLLRLRRRAPVRARGPRGDRAEDAASSPSQDLSTSGRCGRATKRSRSSPSAASRSKVQLIDEKTAGPARGLLLHHQGQGHLRRLLRRPARAVDRQAEGVQAAERRRTPTGRATRATSRCSASTARRSSRTRI